MNEDKAREILGDWISEGDGGLWSWSLPQLIAWLPEDSSGNITINGNFNLDQLEAIAWWVRNNG